MKIKKVFFTVAGICLGLEGTLHAGTVEVYYTGPGLTQTDINKVHPAGEFKIGSIPLYSTFWTIKDYKNPQGPEGKVRANPANYEYAGSNPIGPVKFQMWEPENGPPTTNYTTCPLNGSPTKDGKIPIHKGEKSLKAITVNLIPSLVDTKYTNECNVDASYE